MDNLTAIVSALFLPLATATLPVPLPLLSSFSVIATLHAIRVSFEYRNSLAHNHARIGWLQGAFAVCVMAGGGGSTAALIRGEPMGILKSDLFFATYGFFYFLTFSNDLYYNAIRSIPSTVLQPVLIGADALCRAFAIASAGVDGVRSGELGEGKWVAMVLCGTLAGAGGGVWADAFKLAQHTWTFSTPQAFLSPNYDMRAAFFASLFYILSTSPELYPESLQKSVVLSRDDAKAWTALLLSSALIAKWGYNTFWVKGGNELEDEIDEKEGKGEKDE